MKTNRSWRGIFAIGILTAFGLTSCMADKEGNVSGLAWLESSDSKVTFVGRVENFNPSLLDYVPRQSSGCEFRTMNLPKFGNEESTTASGLWCYRK